MRKNNLRIGIQNSGRLQTYRGLPISISSVSLFLAFFCHLLFSQIASAENDNFAFAYNYRNTEIEKTTTLEPQTVNAASLAGVKIWKINISNSLLGSQVGDQIVFPLENGTRITVVLESKQTLNNGDTQLAGSFEEGGRMILTLSEEASFGSLVNHNHNLVISQLADIGQILVDRSSSTGGSFDLGEDQFFADDFVSKNLQQILESSGFANLVEANQGGISEVDMLIVYSSEFKSLFSSPLTRINQLLAFSNDAFARSGILIRLKLAKAIEVPFNNSANIGTILTAATNGTGDFGQLHALRNQYGADLVAVLPGSPGFSASGVAWVNGDNQRYGYSVTRLSPGCCDSVFTHEVGHNLGSGHEHRSANPSQNSPCGGGVTGFACGHGNSSADWGTIMSYLNDRRIGYRFSNLSNDCLGEPCGIAQGLPNAADNRTSFNLSRIAVANFRGSITPPPPKPEVEAIPWLPAILDSVLSLDSQL